MAAFLDTSFLISYYNTADLNHETALNIIKKIRNKEYGYVYTSDYVLDEFFTYMQKRHKNPNFCYNLAKAWINLNEGIAEILEVDYTAFYNSVQLFIQQKNERKPLSLTDCSIVSICKFNDIQYVISFDDGFEGHLDLINY